MPDPPTRLVRRIGVVDAVVIGLGSMIGAGVFAALGPAAQSADGGLLVGLAVAAAVAFANATSSAQLAAIHPQAGGTYVYGRERLGPFWGFAAGWGFVAGKTASCAAIALVFGAYAWPQHPRVMAALAVVAVVAVNLAGVAKTVWLTRLVVTVVLSVLTIVVVGGFTGGTADFDRVRLSGASPYDCLRAGALLFFAFAGYARLATLGEEVRDPARTIPRAIPVALGITLFVYAMVALSALAAVGPAVLAESNAPLAATLDAGSWHAFVPLVRIGAATASLGVLLSLLAGVSRTVFAMAGERDLPRLFAHVHPRRKVPDFAEAAVGTIVLIVVLASDVRHAIGFSSFCVLGYYAITNASALRLPPELRRWPAALAIFGLAGCVVLAVTLPAASIIGGVAAIGAGLAARYAIVIFKPAARW